ncbi:response regulator transcription factor [Dyadobacter sp. CY312]|uniref:LuxR C-terminal-related transcriptional regulator n=1 Tax=Dyadobacter sp. CY312 TaxID=2907303 RepID=UPI001F36AC69|nr:response regulator transcription factor [Dyadobacter sp. CY312]MCE7041737.1 response regulator transcription factor [Dyadobacter sp. CY312]
MLNDASDFPANRVMLLDDHDLFGESLGLMIEKMVPGAQVSYYKIASEALQELEVNKYRYLLTDITLGGMGVEGFISDIKKHAPDLLIIIVTSVVDLRAVKKFMDLGVDAYLSKATNSYELKVAMEKVAVGKKFISSDLSAELISGPQLYQNNNLTQKELEVLKLIAAGHNVRGTSETMGISPYTVMAHRRNIMKKLKLHSAAELVGYAYKNKLI